jgi:hypothetical protein
MKEFKNNKELFRYFELYGKLRSSVIDLLNCPDLNFDKLEPSTEKIINKTWAILDKIKKIEDEYEVS